MDYYSTHLLNIWIIWTCLNKHMENNHIPSDSIPSPMKEVINWGPLPSTHVGSGGYETQVEKHEKMLRPRDDVAMRDGLGS